MDYEKEYKKLKADISNAYLYAQTDSTKAVLEHIFPELAESEDEKIRRCIGMCLTDADEQRFKDFNTNLRDCLNWLEKQGETYTKEDVDDAYIKGMAFAKDELEKQNKQILANSAKTCKDEQKPADKVEPKFKVGDFIVNDYCMGRVVELTNDAYLLDTEQGIPFSCEHNVHLWTIEDAKEGDVLYSPCLSLLWIFKSRDTVYCGCNLNYNDGVFCGEGYFKMPTDAIPSTKGQRELLFSKMKEAGYVWDAEKKELNGIATYCQEPCKGYQETGRCFIDGECKASKSQCMISAEAKEALYDKPAWSEEDEEMLNSIIEDFGDGKTSNMLQEYWLKSLRPQNTWKPSEEIMKGLNEIINMLATSPVIHENSYLYDLMVNLRKELKGE